ncbi:methyltransferase domain-containing protein [Actinoplanes sp. NPDC049802]|uniref:class I SAM-dependent methyltransferase n=1 Tax=Actinoplanes sp. NPDC049802 TaxID=3154742 RepID=UPI0033F0601A
MTKAYDVFDAAAADYDSVGVEFFGPMGSALVAAAGIRAGERVLDVGCGRGAVLFPAAAAAGKSGSVTGIDMAPAMVALTRAATAGLPQVAVQVGDGQSPDFPEGSFDAVTLGQVLFFLPDPEAALRAYHRLLRPGGRLAFSCFAAFDPRYREAMRTIAAHAVDAPPQERLPAMFDSDDTLRSAVDDAGFAVPRIDQLTVRSEFRDLENFLSWVDSHAGRAVLRRVPGERRPELLAALAPVLPDPPAMSTTIRLVVAERPVG